MYSTTPKYEDEPFEVMLKRFNSKCSKGNLFTDIKKNEYYTKKSEIKRKRKKLEKHAVQTNNFKLLKTKIY